MEPNIKLMSIRAKKQLKQWELARAAGIHESEYSKIENGRKIPDIIIRERLAKYLGVKVTDIF